MSNSKDYEKKSHTESETEQNLFLVLTCEGHRFISPDQRIQRVLITRCQDNPNPRAMLCISQIYFNRNLLKYFIQTNNT